MSPQRSPEQCGLGRRIERTDVWFDEDTKPTLRRERRVRQWRTYWKSGLVAGVIAACLAAAATTVVAIVSGTTTPIPIVVGSALTRYTLSIAASAAVGLLVMIAVGAGVGAAIGQLTRRVDRAIPLMMFGLVFAPACWFAVDVFLLRRFAPYLAQASPLHATLVGAGVFGAMIALAVPLRRYT